MNSRAWFNARLYLPSRFFCFAVIIFNTVLAACAPQKLQTAVFYIETEAGKTIEINAEIAKTEEERSKGLMHRKKLPEGEGMLFVFERDQQLSFWMKITSIPLSIAFITSDGRIVEIRDMQPFDLNSVMSSRSVRYALEVPQGWFGRAGVKPGDTIKINL
jgi:uncharacterized membrane protein (UPF0127 family)